MPYYRCPACTLTVHSTGGRLGRTICPNCSGPLTSADRVQIDEHHPAAITRSFAPEDGAAEAARRDLQTLLWNLAPAEYDVVALLVTELITNSVKHSGTSPGASIRLDVALDERHVRVEVRDGGRGFDPPARDGDSPLDSHWGLHLLDTMADRWNVESNPQTLVWFELDRASDEGRAGINDGR